MAFGQRHVIDERPRLLTGVATVRNVAAIALLAFAVTGILILASAAGGGPASDGDFTLRIEVSRPTYAAGEEIDVTTRLTYSGSETRVDVYGPGLISFGVAREDGLVIGPAFNADACRPEQVVTLERDVPHEFAFFKTGWWGPLDSHAEFLSEFFSDLDTLKLPPGTWEISAHAYLSLSHPCDEPTVRLVAGTTVVVTGNADPSEEAR